MSRDLPIPPAVANDPKAVEVARIWASPGSQHVSLSTDAWDDPAAWGLMLVDLARHVAIGYEQAQGRNRNDVLHRIRAGFDAEWQSPTDKPKGGIGG